MIFKCLAQISNFGTRRTDGCRYHSCLAKNTLYQHLTLLLIFKNIFNLFKIGCKFWDRQDRWLTLSLLAHHNTPPQTYYHAVTYTTTYYTATTQSVTYLYRDQELFSLFLVSETVSEKFGIGNLNLNYKK